jgi:hypothetical protein
VKSHEDEEKAEVVLPSLPPALGDMKASAPDCSTDVKVVTAVPQTKKSPAAFTRKNRKKFRRPPGCKYLILSSFSVLDILYYDCFNYAGVLPYLVINFDVMTLLQSEGDYFEKEYL